MRARSLASTILALTLLVTPTVRAQLAEGWRDTVVLDRQAFEQPTILAKDWRYHPGDDPSWAMPDFDDSSWGLALPSLEDVEVIPGGWPGIGWFRRKIMTTADFGSVLGVYMAQAGASEIYLDGRRVASFGTVSPDPAVERAHMPQYVVAIQLEPEIEHVLAIRYSNAFGHTFRSNFRGFEMIVGGTQALTAVGIQMIRQMTAVHFGAIGLFTAFALLFLLLFAFQPRATENLYFAIFNGSLTAMLLTESQANALTDFTSMLSYFKWTLTGVVVMALAALLVEYRVFKMRIGASFWFFLVGAVGVLGWIWTRPAFGQYLPLVVFLVAVYLMTLWLALLALVDRKPDAWIVGVGFLVLTLSVFATLARAGGWLEVSPMVTTIVGLGVLAVCLSVFLTRRIARTNRELAAKLIEVEDLTNRTIEQERHAALEEAERQVLEADNARKTAELEEARRLQLAMLPEDLPVIEHFDLAVHMSTANEVGGDYYDFATNSSGGCTMVVGDATGHGLHAGMVVGAAKSLFQTCSHDGDLSQILERIEAGLGAMHRRKASMAMLLLRLGVGRIEIASAGMPPVLIWRQQEARVEELLLPSVPLGTLARDEYPQAEVRVQDGDTLLVMTDGLAEVVDPAGDLLGYDRATSLFAELAPRSPREVIAGLLERTAEHRSGSPLQDDMTLVVLKTQT